MKAAVPSNAASEIALYESRVDELYKIVEGAAKRFESGASVMRSGRVRIDEQLTGPYEVSTLDVLFPGKPGIVLVPRGIYNIGARGRVDARSRLGTQVLVWVQAEGIALQVSVRDGDEEIESATRPLFRNVPEGWAWTDDRRVKLIPLTENVLIDHVLPELIA